MRPRRARHFAAWAALLSGLAPAASGLCPEAFAQAQTTHYACKGAILGFGKLGDQRLASYQDNQGHRIELWCTRRIFDSQFDLRIAMEESAHGDDNRQDAIGRLATVGGCFFDNGNNEGPIIISDSGGAYAKVEWITEDPNHWRKYRFSYDFATDLITITATAQGCAPVSKVVAPQASYKKLASLLPHPETQACALGAVGHVDPRISTP